MIVKTKRVRRANRTYEYLVMVESVRINGKNTHRRLSQNPGATSSKVGFGGAGVGPLQSVMPAWWHGPSVTPM